MKKLIVPFLIALLPAYASALTPPGSTAEGQVKGNIADVQGHTQMVFGKLGIIPTGSHVEKAGAERTVEGRKGDLNVEVKLDSAEKVENQTKVAVTAKKEGALNWNNDYARKVLDSIIASS